MEGPGTPRWAESLGQRPSSGGPSAGMAPGKRCGRRLLPSRGWSLPRRLRLGAAGSPWNWLLMPWRTGRGSR
eukprot:14807475-Alexandrium_andersonii.AAC.1